MSSTRRDVVLGIGAVLAASAPPILLAAETARPRPIAGIWLRDAIPAGTVMNCVYRCGVTGATFAQVVRVIASEPAGNGMHIHHTEHCGERRAVADNTPVGLGIRSGGSGR